MRLNVTFLIVAAATCATAAIAANGGYTSTAAAPPVYQTNIVVAGPSWSIVGRPPANAKIGTISWQIGYSSPRYGTVTSQICSRRTGACTEWAGLSGRSTVFSRYDAARDVFYMRIRVTAPRNVVLNPTLRPNGNSFLTVNYSY